MKIRVRPFVVGICLFLGAGLQAAQPAQRLLSSVSNAIPELSRPVMDEAGFLPAGEVAPLEQQVLELNRARRIQFAIYFPRSLRGLDIESFSIQVAEKWKLGDAATDRGLLLVLAPAERKMRLEVGYGLEGELTDLWSKRALDEILRPALRANQPGSGLRNLLAELDRKLGLSAEAARDEEQRLAQDQTGGADISVWEPLAFLVMILLFIGFWTFILHVVARGGKFEGRRGLLYSWLRSVSSGGGGFSGGGGRFGGGGASSSW